MINATVRVVTVLLLSLSAIPCSVAGEAEDLFERGVKAFHSADFAAAAQAFERARKAGMDTAALHYNYGSALYRLGRYAEAQAAFSVCARDPAWEALARYNMGLAALQQGQRAEAAEYFDQAWRRTDDARLAVVAQTMLDRIDPMAQWRPRGVFSISLGHDSNVVLSDQARFFPATGQSDDYTELTAYTGARLGEGSNAPRWEAAIYDLRHARLQDYDITQGIVGMHAPWRFGAWYNEGGGQVWRVQRNGGDFQQIAALKVSTIREWQADRALRFDWRFDQIESLDPNYEYLDGRRIEVKASVMQPLGAGWMQYGVTIENNNRRDLTIATEFYSQSSVRAAFGLKGSWLVGGRWRIEPVAHFRYSRYADEDRRASGVVQRREDNDWRLGMSTKYRLSGVWQLIGEHMYSGIRSNFDEFSHTRHQISIGIMRPL